MSAQRADLVDDPDLELAPPRPRQSNRRTQGREAALAPAPARKSNRPNGTGVSRIVLRAPVSSPRNVDAPRLRSPAIRWPCLAAGHRRAEERARRAGAQAQRPARAGEPPSGRGLCPGEQWTCPLPGRQRALLGADERQRVRVGDPRCAGARFRDPAHAGRRAHRAARGAQRPPSPLQPRERRLRSADPAGRRRGPRRVPSHARRAARRLQARVRPLQRAHRRESLPGGAEHGPHARLVRDHGRLRARSLQGERHAPHDRSDRRRRGGGRPSRPPEQPLRPAVGPCSGRRSRRLSPQPRHTSCTRPWPMLPGRT